MLSMLVTLHKLMLGKLVKISKLRPNIQMQMSNVGWAALNWVARLTRKFWPRPKSYHSYLGLGILPPTLRSYYLNIYLLPFVNRILQPRSFYLIVPLVSK